jgi:hypothetical protein
VPASILFPSDSGKSHRPDKAPPPHDVEDEEAWKKKVKTEGVKKVQRAQTGKRVNKENSTALKFALLTLQPL